MKFINSFKNYKMFVLQAVFASFIVFFFSYSRLPTTIHIPYSEYITGVGYIVLIVLWLIPISKRIIDEHIKRHIIYVGCLLIFFMIIRTVKWSIDYNPLAEQILWYLYYIPILFVPYYILLISLSINKNVYFNYKTMFKYVFIVDSFLALLVLTNNYHQFIFKIIEWNTQGDVVYYMPAYYLLSVWLFIQYVFTIIIIAKNSKLPKIGKRIIAPNLVILMYFIYIIFYRINPTKYGAGFIEFTVAFCFTAIALIESFEITGLIQSNTKYVEIFKSTEIPMMIIDENYDVQISSKIGTGVSKEIYSKIKDYAYIDSGDKRVCMKSIEDGYIVWLDDMEMINKKNIELEKVNNEMLIENELLEKEFIVKKRELALKEKNRIYNEIQINITEKIKMVDALIANLDKKNKNELVKICIIGAYIKRISNIILLSQMSTYINAIQLQNAILESLLNFKITNEVEANDEFIDFNMKPEILKSIYTIFEEYLEVYYDKQCKLSLDWSLDANDFKLIWEVNCYEVYPIDIKNFESMIKSYGGSVVVEKTEKQEKVSILIPEEF